MGVGKKIHGGLVRPLWTAVGEGHSGGKRGGFSAGGKIFLPSKGEASLFPAAAVDISVWKTVWIMCKTLHPWALAPVSTDYVPGWALSLFSKFHRFLSKKPIREPRRLLSERMPLGAEEEDEDDEEEVSHQDDTEEL